MSGVEYAALGPWWTLDGPSLRLPRPDGAYVQVWTTGNGPGLLLVPRSGAGRDSWLPLLPHLRDHFTLLALEAPAAPEGSGRLRAEDVRTALLGTGVSFLLADGDGDGSVLGALADSEGAHRVLLHAPVVAETGRNDAGTTGAASASLDDDPEGLGMAVIRFFLTGPGL
jgi:hypothetical protein